MIRKFGAVFAGLAVMAMCIAVDAADDKTPTTKEIMKAVFGKETGLCPKTVAAAKAEKWEDAQKLAKTLAETSAALSKNKPPKGDADSWTKLTKDFADQADAISKAADDKDAAKFGTAVKTFTTSCKACHDAHKGKK